jgi:hypothetical protein
VTAITNAHICNFFFLRFEKKKSYSSLHIKHFIKMDGYQGQPIRQPVAMAYLCAGKSFFLPN